MNRKIFSATALKYIAVISMIIDHIALVFVPSESFLYFAMRFIGRLTAPVMSFFIAEGFRHTHNRKKYFLRMIIFAVISQPFYFLMIFRRTPQSISEFLINLNIMFNFCICLIMLKIVSGDLHTEKKIILTAVCFALSDLCDWSYIVPAWILIFFLIRNKNRQIPAFISVSAVLITLKYLPSYNSFAEFSYQYGFISAVFLIALYNEKYSNSVKNRHLNRWLFYICYPLHMGIICLLYFLKNSL